MLSANSIQIKHILALTHTQLGTLWRRIHSSGSHDLTLKHLMHQHQHPSALQLQQQRQQQQQASWSMPKSRKSIAITIMHIEESWRGGWGGRMGNNKVVQVEVSISSIVIAIVIAVIRANNYTSHAMKQ